MDFSQSTSSSSTRIIKSVLGGTSPNSSSVRICTRSAYFTSQSEVKLQTQHASHCVVQRGVSSVLPDGIRSAPSVPAPSVLCFHPPSAFLPFRSCRSLTACSHVLYRHAFPDSQPLRDDILIHIESNKNRFKNNEILVNLFRTRKRREFQPRLIAV